MKPARIQKTFAQPHSWQQLKNAQWAFDSIQSRLDEWCPKLFGYHMLKLGGLSCELETSHCNIKHQVHLDITNPRHTIIADAFDLPFIEKSIDTALVCHQLDYCSDPHRLLREVDRIIIDDGYIILTGFNSISLTGLARWYPWRKNNLPWSGRMFSPYRIKDWLGVLNYEVIYSDCSGLFPSKKGEKPFSIWLEHSLGRCASTFGGMYFIVARKRTCPLKPLKPHWELKRRLAPASVGFNKNASSKASCNNQNRLK
ncbi:MULTISPECIES: methyltransferase domain-containing protein [Vibrio]|uniref:Methyltransferase domain-containing protein n=1 Tax=Vibrio algicola TaxID=2662262 RepID=A0A5Q0TCV2_9VIBR|nr:MULTISPECIES: methyltransferase domain-containing protein [Vibrio]MBD1575061.1 class I SAM-dependent methyltransferase [Vibrio sp. S11_S32]